MFGNGASHLLSRLGNTALQDVADGRLEEEVREKGNEEGQKDVAHAEDGNEVRRVRGRARQAQRHRQDDDGVHEVRRVRLGGGSRNTGLER